MPNDKKTEHVNDLKNYLKQAEKQSAVSEQHGTRPTIFSSVNGNV